MTPLEIGISVTLTDCHSKSVTLVILNESGIAKTVTVADCHSNRCHSNRRHCIHIIFSSTLPGCLQRGHRQPRQLRRHREGHVRLERREGALVHRVHEGRETAVPVSPISLSNVHQEKRRF